MDFIDLSSLFLALSFGGISVEGQSGGPGEIDAPSSTVQLVFGTPTVEGTGGGPGTIDAPSGSLALALGGVSVAAPGGIDVPSSSLALSFGAPLVEGPGAIDVASGELGLVVGEPSVLGPGALDVSSHAFELLAGAPLIEGPGALDAKSLSLQLSLGGPRVEGLSRSYVALLQALLPRGRAWTRAHAARLTAVLDAIAVELGRLDARAYALVEEADPWTATELLAEWERVVRSTEDCDPPTDVATRRAAVVAKLRARGEQSRAFWIDLLATLGVAVEIEEFQSFQVGRSRCGDPLCDERWRYVWLVVGAGATAPLVECIVRSRLAPHTVVMFREE